MQQYDNFRIWWIVPQRAIMVDFEGEATVPTFKEFDTAVLKMLDEGTAPVFICADVRKMKVSSNPMAIRREIDHMSHPNLGQINLVGANQIVSFLSSVVFKLANAPVRYHNSWEQCADYIHASDGTISREVLLQHAPAAP